jgi:uncharacterized membrane protein
MINQKKASKSNLLLSTFFALTLLNITDLPIQANFLNTHLDFSQQALAKRSGGRSGGGSFSSRSSSSGNTNRTSHSSQSKSYNHTVIIHNSSYDRGYGYGGDISLFDLIFLLVFFGIFGFIAYIIYAQNQVNQKSRVRESREEIEFKNIEKNRQVTISKLHIALTAEAIAISKQLSQLTLSIDTEIQQGLVELLQESMIILLRNSEHWTHISSRSFPIKMDKAEAAFNRLSIAQRSKFSCETVSNVNGKIRNYTYETKNKSRDQANDNLNLPAYVVVTILIGSAGEEPLFHRIHSCEELKLTLEKLAVISKDDLMKLEVLWTPQSEDEPLTNDEFIMEHPDLIRLG